MAKCTSCGKQVPQYSLLSGHCESCWVLVPQVEPFYSTGDTLTEVTSIAQDAANKWLLRTGVRATDVLSTQVALTGYVVDEMRQFGYVITLTVLVPRWKAEATA